MNSSFWFTTINLGWSVVICIAKGSRFNLQMKLDLFLLKISFVLANRVDPDEMPHYGAFHLGLHCLPKYHAAFHLGLHCLQSTHLRVTRIMTKG